MMATVAELQADLEKLKAMRRSGMLRMRFEDREITVRSDAELRAAIDAIERELDDGRPRNVYFRTTKGW
jgi:hypothetical protein